MTQVMHTTYRTLSAGIVLLLVLAALVTLPLLYAVLVAGLLLAGGLMPLLTAGRSAMTAARSRLRFARPDPLTPMQVVTREGETMQARLVPIEQPDGYRLVLTAQGYRVVDSTGQVVHTL